MALNKSALLSAYRKMSEIREFEDRLHEENATGDIPGFIHLYSGQEAIAVGVCENLHDTDYIGSTHRGHGHCIAKGCDLDGMMAEIFGKNDGLCHGKGGSMHIADLSVGMLVQRAAGSCRSIPCNTGVFPMLALIWQALTATEFIAPHPARCAGASATADRCRPAPR